MLLRRTFEILPGFLSWGTLILMVIASRFVPTWTAIFIILFDTYWLFKTIFMSLHLRFSFTKMRENTKINWLERVKILELSAPDAVGGSNASWRDVYHLLILPMYKEPYEIVEESFESLRKMNYPREKFIVVLATEESGGEEAQITARKIEKKFGNDFYKFLVTKHPFGLPGEIPGKGSNQAWAAKEVKSLIIDKLNIPYENILISVFDVDTQILPDYFGILTYSFLTAPNPQRSSYQPIPLFNNNIYEAPLLARVVAFSATFWHMTQQARPEQLK